MTDISQDAREAADKWAARLPREDFDHLLAIVDGERDAQKERDARIAEELYAFDTATRHRTGKTVAAAIRNQSND